MPTTSVTPDEHCASTHPAVEVYAGLSSRAASMARCAADRLRMLPRTAIVERGRELLTAKAVLPHGRFTRWLTAEVDSSVRTARNLMATAEAFGDDPATVAALDAGSLYRLARAPASIRQDIAERAKAGDRPSVYGITRATRRKPGTAADDGEARWMDRIQNTRDAIRFVEGLHRFDQHKCLGILRDADVDDVLQHFG